MHFDMEDKCCIKLSINLNRKADFCTKNNYIIARLILNKQTDNLFFNYHPTIFAAIKESMAKPAAAP
jgi:hypothetical protein